MQGIFMARGGVLALYANARTTGIVVDAGASGTTITPVQDGYALMSGARIHPTGGRALDKALIAALADEGVRIRPRLPPATAGAAAWPASALAWHELEVARSIKESICRVLETPLASARTIAESDGSAAVAVAPTATVASTPYVLPDGTHINVGAERFSVPEAVFSGGGSGASISDSIVAAALACDAHVRRDLVGNLVLAGGASTLSGFAERLVRDVALVAPIGTRPRWATAAPEERKLSAWLGGSILASLGTFPDLWFTAEEYREHGAAFLHRRCP